MPSTRSTDPETSHEAAASVTNIGDTHRRILGLLMEKPDTHHGLRERYERERGLFHLWPYVSDSGLRTRTRELVDRGYVIDSGQRVKLPSRRNAVVWAITDAGQRRWWDTQ